MNRKLELLLALTVRDIQARFKQSIMGVLWVVIQPLALMFVFDLVFSRLLRVDTGGIPYPIFVYSCLVPWGFFANSLSRGTTSIETNSGIIKKVRVTRMFFPISSVLSGTVDLLAASLVFIGMLVYYDVSWTPWMLMVFPLIVLETILVIGLSLGLSAIDAYFRDVKYALPLATQLLFYACPIVYALSVVPDRLRVYYNLNPMVGIMVGFRNVLVKGISPDWGLLLISVGVVAVVFVAGFLIFRKLEGTLADVI